MGNNNHSFLSGSRVAAYLRDSGGDRQELSVSRQESEVRRWCAEHGLILVHIFKDEARLGSNSVGRDGFQAMMHHFRSPACEEVGLIIWNYQRFARDVDDSQFFRADLRRRGFIFHSINDEIPDGPMGRFFEAALDWKNEQFLLDLSADVKSGMRELVERFGAVPGTPPRGFMRQPVTIGKQRDGKERIVHRWVPDPDFILRVRLAFEMKAAGKSLQEINQATRLFGSLNSYSTFFRNRIYIGTLEYSGLVIDNYCEPVIDQQTWDAVQLRIRKHAGRSNTNGEDATHPRRQASSYLFSGLISCAICGSPLAGQSAKQRDGSYHQNYKCSRAKRRRDCNASAIPRLPLEKLLLDTLQDLVLQPDVLQACQDEAISEQAERQARIEEDRSALRAQLGPVRRRIANTTAAIAEAGHSRALLESLARLETEEADLQAQIARLDQQAGQPIEKRSGKQITAMTEFLTERLQSGDPVVVREILRGFIESVSVERDGKTIRGLIRYYYPPGVDPPKADPPRENDSVSSFRDPLGAPIMSKRSK